MKVKYLSYAQAYAIYNDYQYLQDEQLANNANFDIMTIAPYSRILQWQFVRRLLQGTAPVSALLDDNVSARYDVIVVSKTPNASTPFSIMDLRTYLHKADISFDLSRYSCLRSCELPMASAHSLKDIAHSGNSYVAM